MILSSNLTKESDVISNSSIGRSHISTGNRLKFVSRSQRAKMRLWVAPDMYYYYLLGTSSSKYCSAIVSVAWQYESGWYITM